MARPNKQGLDYFPLDVGIFEDDKILAISGEFSVKGEIIVLRLLCEIYRNGYFVEFSELLKNKLARLGGLSGGLVEEVVSKLVKYEFFDGFMFSEYNILTSKNIQKVYLEATKRRKDTECLQYWILNGVNVYINEKKDVEKTEKIQKHQFNGVNVDINYPSSGVNVDINPQSKVKEIYKQTNTHTHEKKPKAENSTLKAYEDFNGDAIALAGWLSKRWNDAKKFYKVGAIGNVAILGNARMNLIEVAKNYTQGEIELAIKGVFIQKDIYPQFTLSPDKMLETDHFSTFYNAGLTNTQLYNKEPQKGLKSSKKGVVRNIGDL